MKTLYFEGAGCDFQDENSDVGNYRIRTAFANNKGEKIYLELGSCPRFDNKLRRTTDWALRLDFAFYITGDKDDCNNSRIEYDWLHVRDNYMYTREDIARLVNELCNTSFDTIRVLPRFEGYRVHGSDGYNLIDDHKVNLARARARELIYSRLDSKIRQSLSSQYSQIHMLGMDEDSITIRIHASEDRMKRAGISKREYTAQVIY